MELVLASGNAGKLREIAAMLDGLSLTVRAQSDFNVGSVAETGTTFVENAIIKARHAARMSGRPALADDSGIAVDALGGAPGVFSARYAGEPKSDARNNEKLLADLDTIDWSDSLKEMQRNWIGRSEGAHMCTNLCASGGRTVDDDKTSGDDGVFRWTTL